MTYRHVVLGSLLIAAVPAPAVAQTAPIGVGALEGSKIVEIDVVENTKTDDETVKLIADISVGDRFTYALIEQAKIDLVSSGLFKDVNVFGTSVEGGTKLIIEARDKHSWIIAPTVYLQPGNQGGGVGFGENNLFGQNKKLLLYGQIATADSLFIGGYLDPSLFGSRHFYWRTYTLIRRELVTEYTSPTELFETPEPDRTTTMWYVNGALLLGINLVKGFALDSQIRGAWVAFEDPTCDVTPAAECAFPDRDGWDVSLEWKVTRDKRANWYGIASGTMFRLSFEKAFPALGSAWDYWLVTSSFVWAKRPEFWRNSNFILKLYAGIGDDLPFQQEFTAGGVGLRGYRNREFRGDFKFSNQNEYSIPLFRIGSVAFRALAFVDLAYTGFENDEGNPSRNYLPGQIDDNVGRLRMGVGGGFRIYLRSIVLPLLGLDWGYGIQTDEWHMYFAVGLTEL